MRRSNGATCRTASRRSTGQALADELALYRGAWLGLVRQRLIEHTLEPVHQLLFLFGPETLAYMLFGMAALRSGFLAGGWPMARYRQMGADRLRHRASRLMRRSPAC